jgi:chemotaxis response regulator CheB
VEDEVTRGAQNPGTDAPDGAPQGGPFAPLVVAIGASPSGLPALRSFFGALPAHSGHCFLLTQHVAPEQEPFPVEALALIAARPVALVEDGAAVESETVLVIPPGCSCAARWGAAGQIPWIGCSARWPRPSVREQSAWFSRVPAPTGRWGCRQ